MVGLKEILRYIDTANKETLQRAGEYAVKVARSSTNFKHSQHFDEQIVSRTVNQYAVDVWSKSPHSSYLEYGNNLHGPYIYARNAKALRFFIGGNVVFRKYVRSHGPLPFIQPAIDATYKEFPGIWKDVKSKIF